jgi:lauroyl/myristoyl acyltransferase/ADP-heptose:LPS heptosyltransferase
MVKLALQTSGWVLAHLPEAVVRAMTWLVARLFWWLVPSRRRLMLSNLHHAFPDRSPAWRRTTARECVRRFVETAFYSLASPYLSPERIRTIVRGSDSLTAAFAAHRAQPRPTLFCAPHFAHWEAQTVLSLLVPGPFPEFASIFRPIDNPSADEFIQRTRERFGMRLLSRKQGFQEAVKLLRRHGFIGILHDQNAGNQGALTLLFDRVCSTTELPALLATKFAADVYVIFPRYLGFWRVELHVERLAHDGSAAGITIGLNRWLEDRLRADENQCTSWLWGHQRWKTQDAPALRFRLEQKRDLLADELRLRGLAALPRRTRLWVRLPNWLGDVVMALPLLRAIRVARPDCEITFVAKAAYLPWLESLGLADRLRPLPKAGGLAYFAEFWRAREEFIDCALLFTNSTRGDLEAWCTGARQRFGLVRAGHPRPLLTHAFRLPAGYDEAQNHQLALWTDFLRNFGLTGAIDLAPLAPPAPGAHGIGLICGSENTPAKRWPVGHWRALIAAFPAERFRLFGTPNDRAITDAVAAGFGDRVQNLAGRTTLTEFAASLRDCRLLVTNDTGGMHLANALGVPLLGLFGPTNPVRTGPVFESGAMILQPPGCPSTGGGSLADLAPETVVAEVRQRLNSSA